MGKWDCYLFDLDGTLIDTKEMIYFCFKELLNKFRSIHVTKDDIYQYIGLPYRIQLEKYTGPLTDDQYFEMRDFHKTLQRSIYDEMIAPCPGAVETIQFLKERGLPLGVVTSRLRSSATDYLKKFDILSCFDIVIDPSDTEKNKPNPDPVLKALELLQVSAERAVYVGDSIFDIESGSRAGVKTIFTNWGHGDFTSLPHKPDYRVDNLKEIIKPFAAV